jgi:Domain of unknown function (DUF4166)/Saccharopine dehydrogenase NADP binding domain
MTTALKILIIGGYGIFGGRLVELLEDEPQLTLCIGGRSTAKAKSFIASRTGAKACLLATAFDRDGDLAAQLSAIAPDLVVDASGPFQNYGEEPYRVVDACLRQGINYLDLADGSDFVAGVSAFDQQARSAGLFVLSGVSTFPVLTAAAVRSLSAGMTAVAAIRGGIAPSPHAVVGENVIRAIASYAGRPVQRRRNGAMSPGYPFTEQLRYTVAPPGYVPLEPHLFSLVDVPDLRALVPLWPQAKEIWMGAAPVPDLLHRGLIAFAWLVRLKLIRTLLPLAPLFHFATNHVRWGEHRGGMFVEIEGADAAGRPVTRSWHLLAEGDDGPYIPSMAVEAVVRNILADRTPQPGARAAVRDLELDDYRKVFAARAIFTGTRDDVTDEAMPLYQRLLGDAYAKLPEPIRALHDVRGSAAAAGRARVQRGRNPLARLAAALIGFPQATSDTPVRVEFKTSRDAEIWRRSFGTDHFESRQSAGRGRADGLMCEQFGPCRFAIALVADGERLLLVLRRWSVFGIPLPMWLCPRSHAYESAEGGRFNFHVKISHPVTGLIVSYDGWLEPAN